MTNQQKIEFYLSKGFACDIKMKDGRTAKIFIKSGERFVGNIEGSDIFWTDRDFTLEDWKTCELTPIPPKPYEFSLEERAIIVNTGEIERISAIDRGGVAYHLVPSGWHKWYELAPALPEDEECEVIEVVKIPEFYIDELNLTKPDGKKLKIKVVEKQ